eukprot:scaffold2702_cov116-Isochrysis_galbana.AAC.9
MIQPPHGVRVRSTGKARAIGQGCAVGASDGECITGTDRPRSPWRLEGVEGFRFNGAALGGGFAG